MKKILLQTLPHTGTHCLHHLFGVLGGIEVVWHHWEPKALPEIEVVKTLDWKEFVFVRTYRNPRELLQSYKGRNPEGGEKFFDDCLDVFAMNWLAFPVAISIEIDAPIATKTRFAHEIFRRCGIKPPQEAIDYMKTWERINSQYDADGPIMRSDGMLNSIHKGRVRQWHTK